MSDSTLRRWLVVVMVIGLAIIGLSVVPGWLHHVRHLGGHGLTQLPTDLNAWQGRSVPVLTAGVLLAAVAMACAGLTLARPSIGLRAAVAGASLGAFGLLLASAWPITQKGFSTSVDIAAGWPLVVAIVLALLGAVAALAATRLGWRGAIGAGALVVVLAGAGVAGRTWSLAAAEGSNRHWQQGTYVHSTDGAEMTIGSGTISVAGRWSGSLEDYALVAVLTGDPACPDARGSYHVWQAGEGGIRWEMIVDTCADGARAAELTAGTWSRR
ncbi:MAG TPA: hypothetical protein VF013_03930 [Candidatus Limnocylindria bacterium]